MLLKKSMLKYFQLTCLLLCFNFSLSDFTIFGFKFALLNITSLTINETKVKNTVLSDTALWKIIYGQNSPINTISGKLVLIKSSNNNILSKSDLSNGTMEFFQDNNGCSDYLNENLPENFIAVKKKILTKSVNQKF